MMIVVGVAEDTKSKKCAQITPGSKDLKYLVGKDKWPIAIEALE